MFNTLEIDSNSDKYLIYDTRNPYIEDDFNIYFRDVKISDLYKVLEKLNIKVLSYSINGKKYYARDLNDLNNQFIGNLSLKDKIFYENNDYYVDSVHVLCEVYKLDILNTIYSIY